MKIGEKITCIFIPDIGFIKAADTIEETMERINKAEIKKENHERKMVKKLNRQFPDCVFIRQGNIWRVYSRDGELRKIFQLKA